LKERCIRRNFTGEQQNSSNKATNAKNSNSIHFNKKEVFGKKLTLIFHWTFTTGEKLVESKISIKIIWKKIFKFKQPTFQIIQIYSIYISKKLH